MNDLERRAQLLAAQWLSEEGIEAELDALEAVLKRLPDGKCLYERGVHASACDEMDKAIAFLCRAALEECQQLQCPIPCDELINRWVNPFDDDDGGEAALWSGLAEVLNEKFPDSAAVLLLRAYAEVKKENTEAAIDYLVKCLGKDNTYWAADNELAGIFEEDKKNFQAARKHYEQSLVHAPDEEKADIYFDLGWCCGKLKDRQAEERAYRACLELNADREYIWRNLGWTLLESGKLEESVGILKEAIRRDPRSTVPYKGLIDALRKLGRYSEAIAVLETVLKNGKSQQRMVKFAETNLVTLRAMSDNPPKVDVPLEETLEALIEQTIKREHRFFDRRLQVYDCAGRYGRQLVIPGIGRIDLLVEDLDSHELIVIELKRDETEDQVVGQTSRYMGWVRENLAKPGQQVRGIICVGFCDEKLRLAASSNPNLEIFIYRLTCTKVS